METPWRIELFGSLQVTQANRAITRFQTAKTAAVLGYIALHLPKSASREVLADLMWSEAEPSAARNSLRVALNSLRRQLEPPGVPPGAVLAADRFLVTLNPKTCITDVGEFEDFLRRERAASSDSEKVDLLRRAVQLYRGELLEGWGDAWIVADRMRLMESCLSSLKLLVRAAAQDQDFQTSLMYARQALTLDPYREGAHRDLMRLYNALGQPQAALRQFDELERLFTESNMPISGASRELASQIANRTADTSDVLLLELESGGRELEDRPVGTLPALDDPSPAVASSDLLTPPTQRPPKPSGILPILFTQFFGREAELDRLCQLIVPASADSRQRLISITGPVGIGKTRLALEACYKMRESYNGRVWFLSLGDLDEGSRVTPFVANALHLPILPDVEPLQQIVSYLGEEPALLVLDNLEQLLEEDTADSLDTSLMPAALLSDHVTRFLSELVQSLPQLILVATTRRRLDVDGEQELVLLPLPTPKDNQTPEEMMRVSSIQLFADRAQAVRPDFQITPGNANAVGALCTRLEGIPLAIELAAAWATALTPAQMLERLIRRFDLLVSRRRDRNARHLTLRAAIDYSYELLPPLLKRFFRTITVFRGGMSLEAVEEVAGTADALELMMQLQQRSLVLTEETGAAMRFRMLETLREYGWDRLTGVEQTDLTDAHAAWFLKLAEQANGNLIGTNSELWLRLLDVEQENIRVAIEHLFARNEFLAALRIVGTVWRFWYRRGYVEEGRQHLDRALTYGEELVPDTVRVDVLEGGGRTAMALGETVRARRLFLERLAVARRCCDDLAIESSLFNLCLLCLDTNDRSEARTYFIELLSRRRKQGDRWLIAVTLADLAGVTADDAEAVEHLEESRALFDTLNAHWHLAGTLETLAERLAATGATEKAASWRQKAESLRAEITSEAAIAASYLNLAYLAVEQGDYPDGCELLQDALKQFRAVRDRPYEAITLELLSRTSYRQRDFTQVKQLAAEALTIRRDLRDADGAAYGERLATLPTYAGSPSAVGSAASSSDGKF